MLVFSDENLKSISTTLKNFEELSSDLNQQRSKISDALEETDKVLKEIAEASAALKTLAKDTDSRVGDVSKETTAAIKNLSVMLQDVDKHAVETTTAVRNAAQVFSQEVTAVSQKLGDAAGSFSRTVESFEDPQRIITGPREKALGPGEKIKR